MAKFDTTGYLVVKISDNLNEKNAGRKCIPARWAENALRDNYLVIRYPEEENSETRVQVKNKEPSKKTWPFHCALIMFRTDSYEKAIEFITENDKQDLLTAADGQPDNTMNETKASATPSTSSKRIQSEETYNNTNNEDSPPKKKRESAIRSGNNLKMLIQNKLLHYFPKQKVPPKKILSLQKEARTETLETLISAGKFNKLDKLYSKTVAVKSHGSTVNDETIATDDSDSNNEPETIRLPDKDRLELIYENAPNPTNTTINFGTLKIPLPETVDSDQTQISSTNNLDQLKETKSNDKGSQSSLNANVSALQNLIHNLAPENGTEHQNIADIKHIKDIYNTILEVKSKMDAVYQEKSKQLKKTFESIHLFVPEIKKGLSLPTIQQLKEKSWPNSDKPKPVSSRQEQPSQRKGPSSHPRTSSLQQSESSSDSESFSQSTKPSTFSKCSYVAKWTLKHQGPGSGLTELMPNTGIYVSEAELTRCKLLGTEMRKFARLLLPLIFTKEALFKCSYTDNGRNGKRSESKDKRPGLDKHAKNVLIDYVNKHAKESGWTIVSREAMDQSLRDKLRVNYTSSVNRRRY